MDVKSQRVVALNINLSECTLFDTVVGRAGALMMVYLGVRNVHAGILSKLAIPVFETAGVSYEATKIVDRIGCCTEDLLADEIDPAAAFSMLSARAGRKE